MNYKLLTGIFVTTTVVFAAAFAISLFMLLHSPTTSNFPGGDMDSRPSFGEWQQGSQSQMPIPGTDSSTTTSGDSSVTAQ